MEKEKNPGFTVWVDWVKRIISFHEAEGFEPVEYTTREEMLSFAVAKGSAGFGIQ